MSKYDLKQRLDDVIYSVYNGLASIVYWLSFSNKRLVKKNKSFEGIHKGKRCFIFGTGPSLNLISNSQIQLLKEEVVFGTNSFYKTNIGSELTPNYYALLDNLYWTDWDHTFFEVESKYKRSSPVFITDYRAKSILEKSTPEKQHIYICSKKYPVKEMSEDLSGNIYAANNVVSYSILSAMYMGFDEIYLLGCDYNAFCTSGKGHAYDDRSELSTVQYNLAFYLKFYWITTEFHYLIAKLAKKKKVSIVNLTPNSLLDAYARSDISTVF